MRRLTAGFLIAVIAATTGFFAYRTWSLQEARALAVANLWQVALPDRYGNIQRVEQWKRRILVINFWATWCDPCREEIPDLVSVQTKYAEKNVQLVGIAADSASKVRKFAEDMKIEYPLLIGGADVIELMRTLGNKAGALPFTVVVGPAGEIISTRLGRISVSQLEQAITVAAD